MESLSWSLKRQSKNCFLNDVRNVEDKRKGLLKFDTKVANGS